MDYKKEAERYLHNYRDLKQSLQHINYQIKNIQWETAPQPIHAVEIDRSGIRAGKTINTMDQFYRLMRWEENRKRTEKSIKQIEEILKKISQERGCEDYEKILTMWYVEKVDKQKICSRLKYSIRHIYRLRDNALKKFATNLFGVDAMQNIKRDDKNMAKTWHTIQQKP